jgi:hypothetical protein
MILPRGKAGADSFTELRLKPAALCEHGLCDFAYPVRMATLKRMLFGQTALSIELLILGLMDWLDVTEAPLEPLAVLRTLIDRWVPPDTECEGRCDYVGADGSRRRFYVGAVDCRQAIVTWQRREWVVAAAATAIEPGRMVVAAPTPLTLAAATSILNHASVSFMELPVDSIVEVQVSSGRTGAYYRWAAGEITCCSWEHGLGWTHEDHELRFDAAYRPIIDAPDWLAPNQVAAQIALVAQQP